MLNQCVLTGNLGDDPEIFYSTEGEPIANFNLAFRSSRKKTGWVRVSAFGHIAELVEKFLHKGARIAIIGTLEENKWETDDGQKRSKLQLIARNIEFIKTDGRGFDGTENDEVEPF